MAALAVPGRVGIVLAPLIAALVIGGALIFAAARPAQATAAFTQQTGKGCPICHTAPPNLNATGKKFKTNGNKF